MQNGRNGIPSTDTVSTRVRDAQTIAEALSDILADTYHLTFKTHAYHWNVEGPMFFTVHKLTEELYNDMFQAADEVAERIRALGQLAPYRLAEIISKSKIEDASGGLTTEEMVSDLAIDHERVAHRSHALIELVEGCNDPVIEDLAK